jgi:CubicO group peptidase (beta-lactamase class C family)
MTMQTRSGFARMSRRQAVAAATSATVLASTGAVRALAQPATPGATPAAESPGGITSAKVQATLDQIPGIVQNLIDQTGVPGIGVGVVFQDEVVFAEGFGLRDIDTDLAIDADTVFQIASVSKPLASTVVAALVGEGHLTWDTKVADIDPTFALPDPWVTANVTVADLFSHRSGLADHVGDTLEDLGGDRELVLHQIRYVPLEGEFRASYAYTNFGLTAGAVAAATAAGGTWEDLSAEKLYGPAGMTSTSSRYSDYVARDNRAALHMLVDGTWVHGLDRQPDAQSPAGGVSSSVRDMSQWLRLQLGNGSLDGEQLVDANALNTTHLQHAMNNVPADPNVQAPGFYGLGWNVQYNAQGLSQVSHSGAFASGAATSVYVLPQDQLGVVVLTNGTPLGVAETIALSIVDLSRAGEVLHDYLAIVGPIIGAASRPLYGQDVAEAPVSVDPPAAPETYLGTYENDFYGNLEVVEDGEHLALRLGPNADLFPMAHYTRDVYTFEPTGENGGVTAAVTFTVGADAIASQVVVENLNLAKAGTFVRAAAD